MWYCVYMCSLFLLSGWALEVNYSLYEYSFIHIRKLCCVILCCDRWRVLLSVIRPQSCLMKKWVTLINKVVERFFSHGPISYLSFKWLNTFFDTCVSFTFFSKTLDLLVTKNGSKQVNNTECGVLIVKLTYVPLPWQHQKNNRPLRPVFSVTAENLVIRFSF